MVGLKTFEHNGTHSIAIPLQCVKRNDGNYIKRQCRVRHNGDEYDDTCWCCVTCEHIWFEDENDRGEYEIALIGDLQRV